MGALAITTRDDRKYTGEVTRGIALGLLAALLFGASVPVTKVLAGAADPLVIAGLLYLGAGAVEQLGADFLFQRANLRRYGRLGAEASFRRLAEAVQPRNF